MSSTSKILLNKVTDEVIIQLLQILLPVLEELSVEYFMIGAFARDVELLAKGHTNPPTRKTKDIDLAVLMGSQEEFQDLKNRIIKLSDFAAHEDEPYRFLFKNAYEVDFLPFGAIANEKGQVELKAKQTVVLDIPGVEEVEPWAHTVETAEGLRLRVSSLPGVILLKLFAWEDRPERQKDIQDIDYILKNFYFLYLDDIFETDEDLLDLFADEQLLYSELVSARYVGRQMGLMLADSPALAERLLNLLEKEAAGYRMSRLMSQKTIENNQRIIKELYSGMIDQLETNP